MNIDIYRKDNQSNWSDVDVHYDNKIYYFDFITIQAIKHEMQYFPRIINFPDKNQWKFMILNKDSDFPEVIINDELITSKIILEVIKDIFKEENIDNFIMHDCFSTNEEIIKKIEKSLVQ